MKLTFDVTAQEYALLRDILAQHLPQGVQVWVFGSRAKQTARFNSDIDLALKGTTNIAERTIAQLKDAFTEAPLPYRVDVVDMASVSDKFCEIIEAQAVEFPMGDTRNAPKLRFPGFEGAWRSQTLSNFIASLDAGVSVNSSDRSALKGEKAVLKTSALTGGIFKLSENKAVCEDHEIERLKEPVQADTIIVSRMNTPALVGENAYVASAAPCVYLPDRLWAAKSKETCEMRFLAHITGSGRVRKRISDLGTGTSGSMKNIGKAEFLQLKVSAPPLPEQRKIAGFLGAVDARIAQMTRKKALLEDYKKGCMQQLFSQSIRFKNDQGNDFPDWEEKRVSDVFEVTRGQVLAVPKMTQEPQGDSTFPVYSSQTKNKGLTGYYKEFLFKNAITWTTDGANAGNVQYRSGKFYCTNVCGVLLSDEGYANSCIAAMLNRVTEKYVSYVGNPKLMNNVMGGIKINFPHPDEQRKIADLLSSLDRKIDLVGQELTHARSFKQGLLQQMFV